MQCLPNVCGVDLTARKALPDFPLLQHQHPVRGQGNALQDVGGEEDRPVLLVPGDRYSVLWKSSPFTGSSSRSSGRFWAKVVIKNAFF